MLRTSGKQVVVASAVPGSMQRGEAHAAAAPDQDTAAGSSVKRKQENDGGDVDSDVVIVEDGSEADEASSSANGFYRASRETGRANILLALQVRGGC